MFLLLVVLALFAQLSAEPSTCPLPPSSVMVDPWGIVNGSVNVISGSYNASAIDITVRCHEPISLHRCLVSCNAGQECHSFWRLGTEYIKFYSVHRDKDTVHILVGESGEVTPFELRGRRDWGYHSNAPWQWSLYPALGKSYCNTHYGELSGQTSPLNDVLTFHREGRYFELVRGSGERRIYRHCKRHGWCNYERWKKDKNQKDKQETLLLDEVIRPNGNRILYTYDNKDRLTRIASQSPHGQEFGWIQVNHQEGKIVVDTSDGQHLEYHTERLKDATGARQRVLTRVVHPGGREELIHYNTESRTNNRFSISQREYPEGRSLATSYYYTECNPIGPQGENVFIGEADPRRGLVSQQLAPVGPNGALEPLYGLFYSIDAVTFEYKEPRPWPLQPKRRKWSIPYLSNERRLVDATGGETRYFASYDLDRNDCFVMLPRVGSVRRYLNGEKISDASQTWSWTGDLSTRDFPSGLRVSYTYDDRHNVVTERTTGALSHSNQDQFYAVHSLYSDDGFNLLLSKDEGRKRTECTYLKGTNLLVERRIYDGDQLCDWETFEYDDNAALVRQEARSASGTHCLIERTRRRDDGLPLEVTELDGSHGQLKRTHFHYDARNRIVQQDVHDADDCLRYSLLKTYDERSRVTSQTDPLGRLTHYLYDANDNIIETHVEGSQTTTSMEYDACNRLRARTTFGVDGLVARETFDYDKMSRLTSSTNFHGGETSYKYDALGRLIEERAPPILTPTGWQTPTIHRTYDAADRLLTETDPEGHTTSFEYTARDQWCVRRHPDGSAEKRIYFLDGLLRKEVHADGSSTEYTRDYAGRVLTQTRLGSDGELVSEKSWVYDGPLLTTYIDPMGTTTHYTYDAAGRIIGVSTEERCTTYSYDPLGRQSVKREQCDHDGTLRITRTEYDLLDRPIATQLEDQHGNILQRTEHRYNIDGNLIEEKTLLSSTTTLYDSLGRPTRQTDAMGNATIHQYDDDQLTVTTLDPLGRTTLTHNDTEGRPLETTHLDSCAHTTYAYDLNSHQTLESHHVLADGQPLRTYTIERAYGPNDQLLSLSQEGRETRYTYNTSGQLITTTKPDASQLHRTYDTVGRLHTHFGPGFSYTYTYDAADRPVHITSPHGDSTRSYDSHGQLTSETLANGLTLDYQRDLLGRPTALILPDGSSITYTYDALYLRSVTYQGHTHHYLSYDLEGRPILQQLPGSCGVLKTRWDALGRPTSRISSHLGEQNFTYDAASNLLSVNANTYTYDCLDQLHGEPDHTYSHDTLGNRLSKDNTSYSLDPHNQLISDSQATYTYDACGRLISDGDETYTYDGLDRLIATTATTYTYDAFNRRLTANDTCFLYQGLIEIGAHEKSLRILGYSPRADIGAAVLIITDQTFIPVHDHKGSITGLLDLDGDLLHSTAYTAFGETGQPISSPWTYLSKRQDGPDRLFFGRRHYSPSLGRWTTPDPAGHVDGPNLYAYCHNNPFTYTDTFGLFSRMFPLSVSRPSLQSRQDIKFQGAAARSFADSMPRAFVQTIKLPWQVLKVTNNFVWHPKANFSWLCDEVRTDFNRFRGESFGESMGRLYPNVSRLGHSDPVVRGTALGNVLGSTAGGIAGGATLGAAAASVHSLASPASAFRSPLAPQSRVAPSRQSSAQQPTGGVRSTARGNRLNAHPDAKGAHTSFKIGQDGRISGYETYYWNPQAERFLARVRFRGTGKAHGKVNPPFILGPKPGKIGGTPKQARPPQSCELPLGY